MPLIKHGRRIDDPYARILGDEPVPADRAALVDGARLLANAGVAAGRTAPLGVVWPNDRPVAELAPYLHGLALVALVFPTFKDGRAYTQARQLREQLGWTGELRATGNVLRDQFLLMARAGFDAFEITKAGDIDALSDALQRYRRFYQPAADGAPTMRRARLG